MNCGKTGRRSGSGARLSFLQALPCLAKSQGRQQIRSPRSEVRNQIDALPGPPASRRLWAGQCQASVPRNTHTRRVSDVRASGLVRRSEFEDRASGWIRVCALPARQETVSDAPQAAVLRGRLLACGTPTSAGCRPRTSVRSAQIQNQSAWRRMNPTCVTAPTGTGFPSQRRTASFCMAARILATRGSISATRSILSVTTVRVKPAQRRRSALRSNRPTSRQTSFFVLP